MYIARDEDGVLFLYDACPVRLTDFFASQVGYNVMPLEQKLFPEVTWENSPVRVELSIVGLDRNETEELS